MSTSWESESLRQKKFWIENDQNRYFDHRFYVCSFDFGFYFLWKALIHPRQFVQFSKLFFSKLLAGGKLKAIPASGITRPERANSIAIVVTFDPDGDAFENLKKLGNEFKSLIVVDNSTQFRKEEIEGCLKSTSTLFKVLHHGNRDGLAGALNLALRSIAQQPEEGWFFLFDQDSIIHESFLNRVSVSLTAETAADLSNTLYGVGYAAPAGRIDREKKSLYRARVVITSGSFMRIQNLARTGLYIEDMFIDSLDHEYCMRVKRCGMKIKRIASHLMEHKLGEVKIHPFLWKKNFYTTNHSAFRWYFFARNFLFSCFENFPYSFYWFVKYGIDITKAFIKMLVFEENRMRKLKAWLYGTVDGITLSLFGNWKRPIRKF